MRYVALFLFAGLTVLTRAQAYRPMLVDGASWNLYQHMLASHDYKHVVVGDSVVGGTAYKILTYGDWPYGFNTTIQLWREDTVTRQVFQLWNGTEQLFYDWSVQVGDTISVWGITGNELVDLVLDSASSAVPTGVVTTISSPRFLYFHVAGFNFETMVWSEGVGSLAGLEWQSTGWDINYDMSLTLCHTDSTGVRDHEIPVYQADVDSCIGIEWSSVAERFEQASISCHPNPVHRSATFTLSIHEPGTSSRPLEILDAQGRVVRHVLVRSGPNTIPTSGLEAGLYHVMLVDGRVRRAALKLIVE